MKLGTKIFFCFLTIFSICFYYPLDWMMDNLRTRYLEGVEEPIVDQATILASIVGSQMEEESFDPDSLYNIFQNAQSRIISAKIYELVKSEMDMYIYITDKTGKVIFHSQDRSQIGKDYSTWRDVRLTLNGEYGARTTQSDENEPTSSVLFVASPVLVHGQMAGVLTVAKPTTNINTFLQGARPRITKKWMLSLLSAILLSLLASAWITRPIKRLTEYANQTKEGKRAVFPKLDNSEIGEMGQALKKMQETLEGKNYIEEYIQSFTHEVKSPLSAIRGAAELLEEKMDKDQRMRFLSNIRNETHRIQIIVDKMLELSSIENLKSPQKNQILSIDTLIKTVVESKRPQILQKKITPQIRIQPDLLVGGDAFLLQQAIGNLVDNAIDFAPAHSDINIFTEPHQSKVQLVIEDRGPGIPEFAWDKIYCKFFSLKRPDTGQKSTGLGLNFVKEVAALHNGQVTLENRTTKGTRAILSLPLSRG